MAQDKNEANKRLIEKMNDLERTTVRNFPTHRKYY